MSETPAVKPTLLVIDDELQIRRLLRACLDANGYGVLEAATGQEGISEAAQHRPDVVVLNLGLPDMDGVTVLNRLREWLRESGPRAEWRRSTRRGPRRAPSQSVKRETMLA